MVDAWPSSLGCAILDFSEQRQRNIASFKPDVGPPKMRRRSTAVGILTSVAFRMTNTQLSTFDTFFVTTLVDGTLPFSMNHPRTAASYNWMFVPDESPTIQRIGPRVSRVGMNLIRLP
jgi:hypothetical protein